MLIFLMYLESKFQRGIIANQPKQLLNLITKGQGHRSVTLLEGQNIDFIFLGRSEFLKFLQHSQKLHCSFNIKL
jgi:hypothetical protein